MRLWAAAMAIASSAGFAAFSQAGVGKMKG